MAQALLIVAHTVPSRAVILEFLGSLDAIGLARLTLRAFWPSLAFSAGWLVWGRLRSWAPAHYSLPLLACAWQASRELLLTAEFGTHSVFTATDLIAAVLAFVTTLVMVVAAVGARQGSVRGGALVVPLAIGVLAFATVVADYSLLLVLSTPIPD